MIANRMAASDKKLVFTAIRIVLLAITSLLLQGLLLAQTSGTIQGSVKDQSGAVLPEKSHHSLRLWNCRFGNHPALESLNLITCAARSSFRSSEAAGSRLFISGPKYRACPSLK